MNGCAGGLWDLEEASEFEKNLCRTSGTSCFFLRVCYNGNTILMEVLPMAYKITSACVSCSDTCPNGAIVPEE